jgi:predicted nucleotide-binding protein
VSEFQNSIAKLAGIRKAVEASLDEQRGRSIAAPIRNYAPDDVGHYFAGAARQLVVLRTERPHLFGDFRELSVEAETEMGVVNGKTFPNFFARAQLQRLARDIDQIFEIRANSELSAPAAASRPARVFISHGRAPDWREVQSFIERDLKMGTLELAQEPNQGMSILTKLVTAADQCDSAVIVMTGDDFDSEGQIRARENVIHEIGYFQGKYGLSRVVLLHEEGVNIPSNIHGLVYTPFPKGVIGATSGLLARELNAMYQR